MYICIVLLEESKNQENIFHFLVISRYNSCKLNKFFMSFVLFEIVANMVAVAVTARILPGFDFVGIEQMDMGSLISLLITATILTLLNLVIRPMLKLFLFPIIILTFGFASILINLLILSFLDYLIDPLSITGLWGLVWSAFLIGWINTLIHQFKR